MLRVGRILKLPQDILLRVIGPVEAPGNFNLLRAQLIFNVSSVWILVRLTNGKLGDVPSAGWIFILWFKLLILKRQILSWTLSELPNPQTIQVC